MRIAVSACLMGRNCKYNGGNNLNEALVELLKNHEVVEVCPEDAGGLPTPRPPAEIVGNRVINTESQDVTREFLLGVQTCMNKAVDCDTAILQPRSPSCGVYQIYDGTFNGRRIDGQGMFARALIKAGVPCLEPDEAIEMLKRIAPRA